MANVSLQGGGSGSVYPGPIWTDFPTSSRPGPADPSPAGANDAGLAGAPDRASLAQQYHTPSWIANDYWAPDWQTVFANPSRWGSGPNAPQAPAPTQTPFDVNAFLQGWTGSGGRTNQDWATYYNSHPEAAAAGYTLPTGSKNGELLGPNGTGWDTVYASGMGGQGAQAIPFGQGGPAAAPMPQSSYAAQFDDPSTKNLEAYVNQLIASLKQPPFTGQEQEILRTQALDPIEHDRAAAKQRALTNIGARGFDPTSGIAQDLLNQVDRGFDTSRATAQNQIASATIGQSRANQQQVLNLLGLLYQLPRNAQNDALAVLGMGPNPNSLFNSYAQLGAMNNANSAANGQWLGSLLAYLLR